MKSELFSSELAGAAMANGVDCHASQRELTHFQTQAELREIKERIVSLLKKETGFLLSKKTSLEEKRVAISQIFFAGLDLWRSKHCHNSPESPWEQWWLESHGATSWTSQLLMEAPGQRQMAVDFYTNLIFPMDLLDQMERLAENNTEVLSIQEFRNGVQAATELLITNIPSYCGIQISLSIVTTALVNVPELATAAAIVNVGISKLFANQEPKLYDWANLIRGWGDFGEVFARFFERPSRKLILSKNVNGPKKISISEAIQNGKNLALCEYEILISYLNHATNRLGIVIGSIGASTYNPFSLSGLVAIPMIEQISTKIRRHQQQEVVPTFKKNSTLKRKSLQAYARATLTSHKKSQMALEKFQNALFAHKEYLRQSNRQLHQNDSLPWMITGMLAIADLIKLSAVKIGGGAAFTSSSLYRTASATSDGIVGRELSAENARDSVANVANALSYIERNRENHIELPDLETDAGPLPSKITLLVHKLRDSDGRPSPFAEIIIENGITGLNGKSGFGKSTILEFIRHIHLYEGFCEILIDGVSVRKLYSSEAWERRIGELTINYESNEALGFDISTLLEKGEANNLLKILDEIGQSDLANQLRDLDNNQQLLAGFADYLRGGNATKNVLQLVRAIKIFMRQFSFDEQRIQRFLTTKIGQDSAVSAGERARIALAMTLMNEKNLYCIDEVTSNLDSETKRVVTDLLIEYFRDHTQAKLLLSYHDPVVQNVLGSEQNINLLKRIYNLETQTIFEPDFSQNQFIEELKRRSQPLEPQRLDFETEKDRIFSAITALEEIPDKLANKSISVYQAEEVVIWASNLISEIFRLNTSNEKCLSLFYTWVESCTLWTICFAYQAAIASIISSSLEWKQIIDLDFDDEKLEIDTIIRKLHVLDCVNQITSDQDSRCVKNLSLPPKSESKYHLFPENLWKSMPKKHPLLENDFESNLVGHKLLREILKLYWNQTVFGNQPFDYFELVSVNSLVDIEGKFDDFKFSQAYHEQIMIALFNIFLCFLSGHNVGDLEDSLIDDMDSEMNQLEQLRFPGSFFAHLLDVITGQGNPIIQQWILQRSPSFYINNFYLSFLTFLDKKAKAVPAI